MFSKGYTRLPEKKKKKKGIYKVYLIILLEKLSDKEVDSFYLRSLARYPNKLMYVILIYSFLIFVAPLTKYRIKVYNLLFICLKIYFCINWVSPLHITA